MIADLGFGIHPIWDFRLRIWDLRAKRIGHSVKNTEAVERKDRIADS